MINRLGFFFRSGIYCTTYTPIDCTLTNSLFFFKFHRSSLRGSFEQLQSRDWRGIGTCGPCRSNWSSASLEASIGLVLQDQGLDRLCSQHAIGTLQGRNLGGCPKDQGSRRRDQAAQLPQVVIEYYVKVVGVALLFWISKK